MARYTGPTTRISRRFGVPIFGYFMATLALATDYDCWNESAGNVEIEHVLTVLKNNVDLAQRTIRRAVAKLPAPRACACAAALKDAIITERARIPKKLRAELRPIIGKYL